MDDASGKFALVRTLATYRSERDRPRRPRSSTAPSSLGSPSPHGLPHQHKVVEHQVLRPDPARGSERLGIAGYGARTAYSHSASVKRR
jgi:hypothetical protein